METRIGFSRLASGTLVVILCAIGARAVIAEDKTPPAGPINKIRTPAPADFPAFTFANHPVKARALSDYLWYHFSHRLHMQKAMFYQEYLSTADMWLANAPFRDTGKKVQEIFRENLLAMQLDDEGYVLTNQHFSHAHDHGWPFPLWMQSGLDADEIRGVTAGWHFQNDGPSNVWIWWFLKDWKLTEFYGDGAVKDWKLDSCKSSGIVDGVWRVEATGDSPTLTTPEGVKIEAFAAPFLQLRYKRDTEPAGHAAPYIEWLREDDSEFGPDRRVYLHPEPTTYAHNAGMLHAIAAMHRHPNWTGKIKRMRLSLAPGESDVKFDIDSLFTVFDTRHPINNPIFIFASSNYFNWTQDLGFLHANVNRMRLALRYMMTEMGGLEHNVFVNSWPGHDGIAGWVRGEDGKAIIHPGHGIGNNYYDLIPFGWKDCYSTMQYYAALTVMADLEAAIRDNPGWGIPRGALALTPESLREHAKDVKRVGNELFWNSKTNRYFACVNKEGQSYDYGFTWLGLEAIWYEFATDEHADLIMDWISGKRIVEGDTSTGDDIYRWRFGPRATTLRNIEWYGQGWYQPEIIEWGGQIQDGGAVVGFSFYDLYARLRVLGPDDAWERLCGVLEWEKEVWENGGYRAYYADGSRGTTLQGGGTAGGIGVDYEFFESSLLSSIVVYGFLGLDSQTDALRIAPHLPSQCPEIGVSNLLYRNTTMDITAATDTITLNLKTDPTGEIAVRLEGDWKLDGAGETGDRFTLKTAKKYTFRRASN